MKTPQSPTECLKMWREQVRGNQRAHYEMEERCNKRTSSFGALSAILSALVAVLLLVIVRVDPPIWLRILMASISIIVAAITTITTSAKWSEKASQHHSAAVEYGKIRRKIEEIIVLPPELPEVAQKSLKLIREKMDQIPGDSPPVPKDVWESLSKELTPDHEELDALVIR